MCVTLNPEELQYPSLSQGTPSPQEAYELEQTSLFKALESTTTPSPQVHYQYFSHLK